MKKRQERRLKPVDDPTSSAAPVDPSLQTAEAARGFRPRPVASPRQATTGQQPAIAQRKRDVTTERKKLIALVCLVALWIGLILVQRHRGQDDDGPSSRASVLGGSATPATAVRTGLKEHTTMPRLKLVRLERVRPPYEPEVRNIFGSIEPSAAVPAVPAVPPVLAISPTLPPPPDPFFEEAKRLRFLGYAEAEGKTMAFVADGSEVSIVPEKEVIRGQFLVKEIREDAVLVTSLDGIKEVRLALSPAPGVGPPVGETERGKQR
jgi:hypothetical protein